MGTRLRFYRIPITVRLSAVPLRIWVTPLMVSKEFRRTGMATRLLREIAKAYEGNEEAVMRLQVSSQNEPAERLYRKLGFLTEDEREYYKTEEC